MKSLNQFIGLYPLSKTLRFKLIPVGKTKETIRPFNFWDCKSIMRTEIIKGDAET